MARPDHAASVHGRRARRCRACTTMPRWGVPLASALVIRIVVAEDNLLVRQGVVHLLDAEDDFDVVAECASYDELVAAVDEHRPDVVLTDVRMPPNHTD